MARILDPTTQRCPAPRHRRTRPQPALPRAAGAEIPFPAEGGFTLVEVIVAMAIVVLLGGLALPNFADWISTYQLSNHATQFAENMTRARTEAVRRGHRVNLCKSADRQRCAVRGSWDTGFLLYVDVNRDGQLDDDEPVLGIEGPAPPGITVEANRPLDDYVSYTSLGLARMLNGALQMGTFTVCRSGQRALHVVLANSGRVRIEKTAIRCP